MPTGAPAAASVGGRWVRALRVQQWVKNLLVLVPVLAAHAWSDPTKLESAAIAIVAFCLCASSAYLWNDLADLEADRRHPVKRLRPIASGEVSRASAAAVAAALLVVGALVGARLGAAFLACIGAYLVATTLYTLWLKRVVLVDVFVLAGLYTLRVIAGHFATGLRFSSWLLAFSMFLFLSLALVKRFSELRSLRESALEGALGAPGRGYETADLQAVGMLGATSGYVSVLVLALYATSADVLVLYRSPLVLLLVCPVFLYWISRFWLIAHRGRMDEDPILFAITDRASYLVAGICAAIIACASADLHGLGT